METKAGADNFSMNLGLDGKRIYPCHCGTIHEGDYAAEDWAHHNCLHEHEWMALPAGKNRVQIICPDCGFSTSALIESEKEAG